MCSGGAKGQQQARSLKAPAPPQQFPTLSGATKNLNRNPMSRSESERRNPDLTIRNVQEVGSGEVCVP